MEVCIVVSENKYLLQLQGVDLKIDNLKNELENLTIRETVQSLKKSIIQLEQNRQKSQDLLEDIGRDVKKVEDELALINDKLEKEEKKLYSGTITNPKELGGIEAEVKSLKRKSDDLETTLLEKMDNSDTNKSLFKDFEKRLNEENKQLKVASKKLEEEENKLSTSIEKEESDKQDYIKKIDSDNIELYQKLRDEKKGLAVVEMIENICQGCHVELPAGEADKIYNSQEYFRCPNCRRILIGRS